MSFASSFAYSEDYSSSDEELPETDFALPARRDRWENDDKCQVCLVNFNIQGVSHTKKSMCKFCYRGVCLKCLTHSATHPETKVKEKMCRNCKYDIKELKYYASKIQQAKYEKSQLLLEVDLAVKEKSNIMKDRQRFEENFKEIGMQKDLEKTLLDQRTHKQSLDAKKQALLQGLSELNNKIQLKKQTHQASLKDLKDLKTEIAEHDKMTSDCKQEIAKLKEKKLQILNKEKHEAEPRSELESIKAENVVFETKINAIHNKNKRLASKIEELKINNQERNELINELGMKVSFAITTEPGSDIITEQETLRLEEMAQELKQNDEILSKLKARLELVKIEYSNSIKKLNERIEISYSKSLLLSSYQQSKAATRPESKGNSACRRCILF